MSPRSKRRQVFDPHRLGDIDDLLPPPPAPAEEPPPVEPVEERVEVVAAPVARFAPEVERRPERQERPREAPPARQPKGQGGRPATRGVERPTPEPAGVARVAVPVRIPPGLYNDVNNELLSSPERPSYGQLVLWTCEDHLEDVVDAVRQARPRPGERRPRGHTLASEGVQITLRMTAAERTYLDDIAEQARAAGEPKPVTRTEVATAALRLALLRQPR